MLRLPVQIGATGLASLARAAAFVFPGGVLILPALYVLGELGIDSEYLFFLVAGPPFFLLFFGIRDLKRQTNRLDKQCDANDQPACVALGQRYPSRNWRRAEQLFTAACDRGVVEGCSRLGDLWSPFWFPETRPLLDIRQKACDLGSGDACETLGELLLEGDRFKRIEKDLPASTAAHARGCALASAGACTDWGYALFLGRGVAPDPVEAVRAYRRGCDLGSAMGCNNLGSMYEKGDGGLPVDLSRASALYTRACDAHVDLGCRNKKSLAGRRQGGG